MDPDLTKHSNFPVSRSRRVTLRVAACACLTALASHAAVLDFSTPTGPNDSRKPYTFSPIQGPSTGLSGIFTEETSSTAGLMQDNALSANNLLAVRAKNFYRGGDITNALMMVEEIIKTHTNNVTLLTLKASMELDLDRYSNAVFTASMATNIAPDNVLPLAVLAPAHLRLGKPDRAEAIYEQMLRLHENNAIAHQALGNIKCGRGDYKAGIAHYENVATHHPTHPSAIFSLGIAHRETGAYDKAINCLNKVTFLRPDLAAGYNELGIAYDQNGQKKEAIEAFREAITRKPDYVRPHTNISMLLATDGEREQSLNYLLKALEIQPNDPASWSVMLSLLDHASVRSTNTNTTASASSSNDDKDPRLAAATHYKYALAALKKSAAQEANREFLQTLRFQPQNPEYLNDYGALLASSGLHAIARPFFMAALAYYPDYKAAKDNLAAMDRQLAFAPQTGGGSTDTNIELQHLASNPENARQAFNTAITIAREHNIIKALPYFEQAATLAPQKEDFLIGLSKAYSQTGQKEKALETFRPVFKKNQRDPSYQFRFVMLILGTEKPSKEDLKLSIQLAERMNAQTARSNVSYLKTLASAYQRSHQLDQAMDAAREALTIAQRSGITAQEEQINALIESIIGLE